MKKVLSILLTVALILSLTPYGTSNVFAADITEPIEVTSGDTVLPDGDNVTVIGNYEDYDVVKVLAAAGVNSSLKVNGNVSLIGDGPIKNGTGGYVESINASASLSVSGNVFTGKSQNANGIRLKNISYNNDFVASADVGGSILVEGERFWNPNLAYGIDAYSEQMRVMNASVGKDISVKGTCASGIYHRGIGKVTVGGSIFADSNIYDSDGNITDRGIYAVGTELSSSGKTEVDIKGSIFSSGACADGAVIYNKYSDTDIRGEIDLSVGKDIIVQSSGADDEENGRNRGIYLFCGGYGDIFADVKGDIKVSKTDPSVYCAGIDIIPYGSDYSNDDIPGPFYNNVHVHGDVISDDSGICIDTKKQMINNILIEGTVSGAESSIDFDDKGYGVEDTNLTVWKIIPNANGHITEYYWGENKDKPVTELEKKINYIIRTEQPSAGGTFSVVKADGNVLDKVEDLEVAHEGEKVYIKPELKEGYTLKAAYNGEGDDKKELSKDDGGYYIVVPKGGGVTLSVDVEEAPKSTPTPTPTPTPDGNDGKDGNGNNQDGNGNQDKDGDDITKDIPFAENIPVEEKQTVIETANTDKNDIAGSTMKYLGLKAAKVKKNSIKLSWKKVKGADGYIIYGNKCGKKMKYITTIKNGNAKSYTAKKLKKGKYYKYMVVAYKTTASGDKVITTSKSVHAATDGGKKGNPTSIKVKKTKVSLKKGKTAKIKASFKKKKKVHLHIAKFRYESLDESIAIVDKKGKIKGVSKGTTKILVYTQNGLSKTIKVTVK